MNAIFSSPRLHARYWSAFIFAAPLWFAAAPAGADSYGDRPDDGRASETAAQIDPFDPVPEIGRDDCRDRDCRPSEHHAPSHRPPEMPSISGHPTLMVDCSGQRRDMFPSLQLAARSAPPNATILVLPPNEGMTCRGTVFIHVPLTIATYGGGDNAVIQAPPGRPCLVADIPLGDTLNIEGVRFVARGGDAPCVVVQAGHVVVRHSSINSRTTNWAFDVRESGDLAVEATHVETDRSGVRAWRAHVDLHGLDVDIDARHADALLNLREADCTSEDSADIRVPYSEDSLDEEDNAQGGEHGDAHGQAHGDRHEHASPAPADRDSKDRRDSVQGSIGLALECTDGVVDAGNIIGGAVGILASAGTHGLQIKDANVRRARTGILLLQGQLGSIDVEHPVLSKDTNGVVVAPGAELQVTGAVITESEEAGITVYGTNSLISGNKVVGAEDGIRLFAAGAFPPPYFAGEFSAQPPLSNEDGVKPIVENNLVANVRHAAVRIDGRVQGRMERIHGRVIGNTFYARHAECIDDKYNDDPVETRANTCNKSWFSWPF